MKKKENYKVIRLDINESPNLEKQVIRKEFKLKENVSIINSKGDIVKSFIKDEIIEDCNIYYNSLFINNCVELHSIDGPQPIEPMLCDEDQIPDQESISEGDSTSMPLWQCHKKVYALKIKSIEFEKASKDCESRGGAYIMPEDINYSKIHVDSKYLQKHQPQVGGYYVVYKDGYKSYSPADAFEEGYTLIKKIKKMCDKSKTNPKNENGTTSSELPKYKCYKEVEAFKIDKIELGERNKKGEVCYAILYDEDFKVAVEVMSGYLEKHKPTEGGYYVKYKDGYESFSPVKAFEDGYELIEKSYKALLLPYSSNTSSYIYIFLYKRI